MEDQSHTVNLEEIDTDSKADGERRGCMVKYEKILDPQGPFTNWIFLMLCVISISVDPLFFYIPVIKVDKNCMELDKYLGVISSVFRSVIDLFYIICIRYQLRTNTPAQHLLLLGHPLHKSYIDLLAVLPLPQVPNFGSLPVQQLKAMCERLKPVLYPTQTCIVGEGDPVDEMFFIMSGTLSSTRSDGRDINFSAPLYLDEFCGEELSTWVQSSSDQLPISTRTIKTHTEVEAFALMANDLKDVFNQFRRHFPKGLLHILRYHSLKRRHWAACIIQVAWRCYGLKKHDEDEKRVKNELATADGSSTSSVGATPFEANEIRRRNSKTRPGC
ncbi:hypothetical protein LWI29_016775 [Acer saccharum]|uniref:Cyclic nucleotide-binding domain-containing protein n=1 Tax=Acer saccharum TaxID=4024 RepID=A0AA39SLS6_ACESA|nr:hypothetical protein LWI29_016775 [Acer saccharum]